jgi:Ca2+-binding RTX toxin-like protein
MIYGGAGNDTVSTIGNGDDNIDGGDGNDFLFGSVGTDTLYGGIGTDWLSGGAGADLIDVSGDAGAAETDTIYAPDEGDTIVGFDLGAQADGGDWLVVIAASNGNALSLADALSQGYVEFVDDGNGNTSLLVDSDGAAGAGAAVAACTFADIPFTTSTAAEADFSDNVVVFT